MKGFALLTLLFSGFSVFSQGKATVEFKAEGCCGMCADRIEDALDVGGVRAAEWSREEKSVFVVYKPKKISVEAIEHLVADAGHDTEHFKADDDTYAGLAECCQYRDGCPGCSEVHGSPEGDDHEGRDDRTP